ncbi:MAG: hypothetical protein HY237_15195 [Acidobacteria bacterium]|nr:hypothetical protein [Acidobacteriota bacterium]
MKISRKFVGTVCLLALAATQVALALPLLAASQAGCCTATLCATHQHKLPAPTRPDCHSAGGGLGNYALQSCHPPEHRVIGLQAYLPPTALEATEEAPAAFQPPGVALFFPTPATEIEPPPPRSSRS